MKMQIDWIDRGGVLPLLTIGNIIQTNYGTGPYRILEISGINDRGIVPVFGDDAEMCTCTDYSAHLYGDDTPSDPHYHIACEMVGLPGRGTYYLHGYRWDGTNVWDDDVIRGIE